MIYFIDWIVVSWFGVEFFSYVNLLVVCGVWLRVGVRK